MPLLLIAPAEVLGQQCPEHSAKLFLANRLDERGEDLRRPDAGMAEVVRPYQLVLQPAIDSRDNALDPTQQVCLAQAKVAEHRQTCRASRGQGSRDELAHLTAHVRVEGRQDVVFT